MNESEAREYLANQTSPKLDAFRATLRTERTSNLIAYYTSPEALLNLVDDSFLSDEEVKLLIAAAVVAVGDEIDRRIPMEKT